MGKIILIVEDEQRNLKLFRELLQSKGHTILEAKNGQEGIDIARAEKPDLILMDIQMPVMDGLAATRILKSDESTRDIPVLALTAFAMTGDRERTLEVGCNGYISKPINVSKFISTIEDFLD